MKKRTFLKQSVILMGGSLLSPTFSCDSKKSIDTPHSTNLKNWAENFEFSTSSVYYPETVEEIQELVKKNEKLRILGSRHSFNKIADSPYHLLSFERMNRIISLDRDKHQVTVEGGIKYGELSKYLHENGYALHNLASLPHITVAGTISTATHGSGMGNGNLATSVAAVEFINASGEWISLSKEDPDFFGAVVGLGGLGPITRVTLDLLPTFEVAQAVYLEMPMASLKDNFREIMGAGYSVSLFLNWKNSNVTEVWVKKKVNPGEKVTFSEDFFGGKLANVKMHPVPELDPESCSEQLGIPGPWFDRLPHFKMEFQPSAGKELQSEYFVPLEKGYEAIMAVAGMAEQINSHLFISEIRSIKGDDLWMSTCFQQDSIAIHTTWKQEITEVMALLPQMESILDEFEPRPHWGKLFTISKEKLASRYPKMDNFNKLLQKHDPAGKFRNDFLDQNLPSMDV